jgi:hypothetical protein
MYIFASGILALRVYTSDKYNVDVFVQVIKQAASFTSQCGDH